MVSPVFSITSENSKEISPDQEPFYMTRERERQVDIISCSESPKTPIWMTLCSGGKTFCKEEENKTKKKNNHNKLEKKKLYLAKSGLMPFWGGEGVSGLGSGVKKKSKLHRMT